MNYAAMLAGLLMMLFATAVVHGEDAGDKLTFHFEIHPPFLEKQEDGQVGGMFGDAVNAAARAAGVEILWLERAFRRTSRDLEDGAPICVAGHTLDEEHISRFRYSLPIGSFGRSGLLVRKADLVEFQALDSVQTLFEKTDLAGGFVAGARYAVPFHDYLPNSAGAHLFLSGTHEQLTQLLLRGRVDFVFENEMMVSLHREMAPVKDALAFVVLPGMPEARKAHVKCTMAVPEAPFNQLNQGIKKTAQK